ncbi:DUF2071 domain-containing protein [bacterium]|nr:DUF2071 domain-containing protein [bacterium]
MSVFLTAQWLRLINITYAVSPEILKPHLPSGLELDLRDGKAFVSFVAFDFADTRVLSFKIPYHVNFPEVNLRYYANYKGRRGVVFLREFVPRFWIAFVADRIYNEPYQAIAMHSTFDETSDSLSISHRLIKNKKTSSVEVKADKNTFIPSDNSVEHFFKEHDVGFGRTKKGETLWYRVEHPVWEVHPISEMRIEVDFENLYGTEWKFLKDAEPYCALLAKGSGIKVFGAESLSSLK